MKIKSDFILHSMGNEFVVVAVNERSKELCGMIRLNSTGAFLWKQMQNDCTEKELELALIEEYKISEELAIKAVKSFIEQLNGANVIEN